MKRALPRVLCIVGPTSAGKTKLGVALAQKFNGEIINADARQVYKDLDIGTGKPSAGRWATLNRQRAFFVETIPHHLMDFLPPNQIFTVAEWRRKTLQLIRQITARRHLPIVVGGTGLYIQALIDNYKIPGVPPQPHFRDAMSEKTLPELVQMLQQMDPEALKVVDLKNRRRVIRALEVITFSGKLFSRQRERAKPVVDPLLIGLSRTREELNERIATAVEKMIERGWADEIRKLHRQGVPWDAPAMTSIGYRELVAYLKGECTLEEAIEKVKRSTRQYAKRQMTWFKRDERIQWVKEQEEAEALVEEWMSRRG